MADENVEVVRRGWEAALREPPDWETLDALIDPQHELRTLVGLVEGAHEALGSNRRWKPPGSPSSAYVCLVARGRYSDEQIDAAIEAISDPSRFSEVESAVAKAAPRLQKVLAEAMHAGGWFGESHEAQALKAATVPDEEARLTAVRTLLAEETRIGMMVGVAVGWALAERLQDEETEPTKEE